jgi:hypothetical protein
VFARSLKEVIAGVSFMTVARRRPDAARPKQTSTPHTSDQGARMTTDLPRLAATDQRTKQDLEGLLDRYGVVS